MTVLPIATIGNPVLRGRAQQVSPDELASEPIQRLIDDMIETKRAHDGAGLAANQVSDPHAIALVEVEPGNPRYPHKPAVPLTVMVNPTYEPVKDAALYPPDDDLHAEADPSALEGDFPEYAWYDFPERMDINEGCLSIPDLRVWTVRFTLVRVRYLDRHGEPHDELRGGLTAGTFQHEIDHLDGALVLDGADSEAVSTWQNFDRYGRADFEIVVDKILRRFGS